MMIHFNRYLLAASLFAAMTMTAEVSATPPAEHCFHVQGRVTLTPTDPLSCGSDIFVCAVGELRGTLHASSEFVGTSFEPTIDVEDTGAALLTGDNAIHTAGGTLYTKDAVVLRTTGQGEFAEVDTVVGGTGDFEHATGVIIAHGTYNPVSGGEGTYFGRICLQ